MTEEQAAKIVELLERIRDLLEETDGNTISLQDSMNGIHSLLDDRLPKK